MLHQPASLASNKPCCGAQRLVRDRLHYSLLKLTQSWQQRLRELEDEQLASRLAGASVISSTTTYSSVRPLPRHVASLDNIDNIDSLSAACGKRS